MTLREEVMTRLDSLTEPELRQVAEFTGFLRFRRHAGHSLLVCGEECQRLFAECADEDRALAEAGLTDWHTALMREDGA